MKKIRSSAAVLLLVAFLAGACSSVKVDDELMGALKEAAEKCELDMKYAFVRGPQEAVVSEMILKKKGVVASLPTLSVALNSEDPKLRVVANKYLYREIKDYISEFEKNRETTPKNVVENLIKGIETSKDYVTYYAVASATMLATLYGLEGRLIKAVEAHPEAALKVEMMNNLVRFGRLRVFPILTAYAESGEKGALARVLDSLRNLYKKTDEEKKAIGDWALTHLAVEDEYTRVRVVYALYMAGGSYYDAALDKFEAEIKAGGAPKIIVDWLKNMGGNDAPEQEKRRLALLEEAAKAAPAGDK
jgi:hypothetical protein